MKKLFTSESVGRGHPDKVADQISDAILDACLAQDKGSRVACEVLVTKNQIVMAGEITTRAQVDYEAVARQVVKEIGYTDPGIGFDHQTCTIHKFLQEQSRDIARGVDEDQESNRKQGAGDQGLMFGYATDESAELMPLPILFSHQLMQELEKKRVEWHSNYSSPESYLRPDGKCQVTVEYDEREKPVRIDAVVLSTQHTESITHEKLTAAMHQLIIDLLPKNLIDSKTRFFINPTGRFVVGGPAADTGLTGRKIIVDTYGGMGRHGGGAFSGKDPSKVDRSAAYAARYVAKHIVAGGWAKRCEVQISYAIGIAEPISVRVDTFGTSKCSENLLAQAIMKCFDLTPSGIIEKLDLLRPIYFKTAFGGHFGRKEEEFSWERVDQLSKLKEIIETL